MRSLGIVVDYLVVVTLAAFVVWAAWELTSLWQLPLRRRTSTLGPKTTTPAASITETILVELSRGEGVAQQDATDLVSIPSVPGGKRIKPPREWAGLTVGAPAIGVAAHGSMLVLTDKYAFGHQEVIEAFERATNQQIGSGWALRETVGDHRYNVDSPGFGVLMRGHLGEQQVFDQLAWAGQDLVVPEMGNNPASDLTLSGQDINIKISDSTAALREHLRLHPDTPVGVNSDMQGLPPDTLTVDLSTAFDPSILQGQQVFIIEGLQSVELEEQWAAGLEYLNSDTIDPPEFTDLAAALGLGIAIRLTLAVVREHRSYREHGDAQRAVERAAISTATSASGAAVGGSVGSGFGSVIDVATFGMTLGLGSLIGGMIGTAVGGMVGNGAGRSLNLRHYERAVESVGAATAAYLRAHDDAAGQFAENLADCERRAALAVDENNQRIDARLEALIREFAGTVEASAARLREVVEAEFDRLLTEVREQNPRGVLARHRRDAWLSQFAGAQRLDRKLQALGYQRRPSPRLLAALRTIPERADKKIAGMAASRDFAHRQRVATRHQWLLWLSGQRDMQTHHVRRNSNR